MPRPTVGGKVTALSDDDITVQTRDNKSVTVVYSSSTAFRTTSGAAGAPGNAKSATPTPTSTSTSTSTSASALKVGDYVGVSGTKNANGTVSASTITISAGPPTGAKAGGPHTGAPPGASA